MNIENLQQEIRAALDSPESASLAKLVDYVHPSVFVEELEEFTLEEVNDLFLLLDGRRSAELFSFLPEERQLELAERLSDEQLLDLVNNLSHDERVDLLVEIPEGRKEEILKKVALREREDIKKLGSYEEGSIGAIMTSEFVTLSPRSTVGQALERIRLLGPEAETVYYSYVLDEDRHVIGVVSLKQLILAKADVLVETVMKRSVITLFTRDPVSTAVDAFSRADLIALPVIDRQDKMVGIVTHDDVADVAEEKSTEDFHKMGAAPGLATISLKTATLPQMLVKRLPWLLFLVFLNIFSGQIIDSYEETILAFAALVTFLPLLIDSGGNAGSQASTLMVRALAVGDVHMKDWFHLLRREFGTAIVMGLVMGLAVSLVAMFRAPEVGLVVALTMVCTVTAGSLIGILLPFGLAKLRFDPASASAPLITSLADISGVFIYFFIATRLLNIG